MVDANRNFSMNRNFDGLDEKVENLLFLIFEFCFHGATLEGDLARQECGVDMVDSVLKSGDISLLKRGTFGLNCVKLRDVQSFLLTEISESRTSRFEYQNTDIVQ